MSIITKQLNPLINAVYLTLFKLNYGLEAGELNKYQYSKNSSTVLSELKNIIIVL